MRKVHTHRSGKACGCFAAGFCALLLILTGCRHKTPQSQTSVELSTEPSAPDPMRLILLPIEKHTALDGEITQAQQAVRKGGPRLNIALEHLGWLFVSKARASFDPGYYKLAEQTALCMEIRDAHSPEALLLRGHVLDNLHKFKEAEPLARELVARRGLSFDYGLLGDVLMEQGRLDEAVAAYQKMADLKPDIQAYARAAHMRWLNGDLTGAIEAMQKALQATTPRDPETAAWVYTRMALYQLQSGNIQNGLAHCEAALNFQNDYPPALLARGRLLLASGQNKEAVAALRKAEALNPLPEYQWTLLDALQTLGLADTALETQLKEHGAGTDPRTYALYLATRNEEPAMALRLAKAELQTRQDVFTHDALAWALLASGQYKEAGAEMHQALSAGTQDARLFFHAAMIQEKLGQEAMAQEYFAKAEKFQQTLLPSERASLAGHRSSLSMSQIQSKTANP